MRTSIKGPREATLKVRWSFRLFAVVIALGCLGLVEILLRAAGVGCPPSFFIEKTVEGRRCLFSNQQFGWLFFPRDIARSPLQSYVPLDKSQEALRVVLLGESVVVGDPDPVFGFCHQLAVMLQAAHPSRHVSVVDAGMPAIDSHVIVEIAKSFPEVRPDFVIIYMGNNEVVGPYGAGTVFSPLLKHLWQIHLHIALKKLRLVQVLESLIGSLAPGRRPKTWQAMAMFVKNQVPADAPAMAIVYNYFEANLNDIISRARRVGAKVLVCTVASNLRDCAPFESLHRAGLTRDAEARWNSLYDTGRRLAERRRWADALEAFDEAAGLDARFADLQFQRGRCLLALGRIPAAQEAFRDSRDLDTLRLRADSRINEIIRRVARKWAGDGVQLVDVEGELRQASPGGLPGMNFFLEHVHPNFDGNYAIARALAEVVQPGAKPMGWEECAAAAGYDGAAQRQSLQRMLPRLAEPPFSMQSNHAEQARRFESIIRSIPAGAAPAPRPLHMRNLD